MLGNSGLKNQLLAAGQLVVLLGLDAGKFRKNQRHELSPLDPV